MITPDTSPLLLIEFTPSRNNHNSGNLNHLLFNIIKYLQFYATFYLWLKLKQFIIAYSL